MGSVPPLLRYSKPYALAKFHNFRLFTIRQQSQAPVKRAHGKEAD